MDAGVLWARVDCLLDYEYGLLKAWLAVHLCPNRSNDVGHVACAIVFDTDFNGKSEYFNGTLMLAVIQICNQDRCQKPMKF